MQNGVSHAAKRVHHWLFCSLAPFVNACWLLAGLLLRHPFPACGIFLLQEQTFSFPLNLVKCFLAQSSSWAVSFWLKLCHLACHLILLIWCHLWTSYHVVLCPCPGHWWDVDWHGHRTDPCRAVLVAGCQQGVNHWSVSALQAWDSSSFQPNSLHSSRQYFLLEGMKNAIQLSRFNCYMPGRCWKLV